jgi:two-component system sensor histidine kinase MprB
MSFRARLTLASALAVAVAVVLVAIFSYLTVQDRLRTQFDESFREQTQHSAGGPGFSVDTFTRSFPDSPLRDTDRYIQLVGVDGSTLRPADQKKSLPVTRADLAVAQGRRASTERDADVGGEEVRIRTVGGGPGVAVQYARKLDEVTGPLSDLRLALILVAAGGVIVAAGLGLLVARSALRPVARLTAAAEHVAETQDLDASIEVHQDDELGRLATSFNAMLGALGASRQQQRQLVADASHELRTPMASMRTNVEVLARQPDMPVPDRDELIGDVVTQLEELNALVDDVVELAREDAVPSVALVDVPLGDVVEAAVTRARRHVPAIQITVAATDPATVRAERSLVERAVGNLVDNARKWSPPGGSVEVTVDGRVVTVRDHGPGIDAGDLPHVFDRFYRAPAARSMPGSGLGLAIVRQVMEAHGGTATVEQPEDGGTLFRLEFPEPNVESAEQDAKQDAD